MDKVYFEDKKETAKRIYEKQKTIYSPYFESDIILNSDGFHHLQFSARRERPKEEQVLKFTLLPLGLKIIKKSGTLQEYRKTLCPIGKKSERDGLRPVKIVECWGFFAIFVKQDIKIRVVVRRVGDGNIIFWSVMPYNKLRHNGRKQDLFIKGIEDD